jgi:hypothetical protein
MEGIMLTLLGSLGTVAFFGFFAFYSWLEYRKKKEERDAAHQERIKALELGHPPFDAEIERARAYSSAAWAAGVIGLVIPIVVIVGAVSGTVVAIIFLHGENFAGPLIAAWSIAALISLVTIVLSLRAIGHLPRPTAEAMPRAPAPQKRLDSSSSEFQEKRLEL